MSLRILVKNASGLRNLETVGKSDPFVSISFQGEKKKTEVKHGTLEPVWSEELTWEVKGKVPRSDEVIDIVVKDHERFGMNRVLGRTSIPLRNVLHGKLEIEQPLLDGGDQPTAGVLCLSVQYDRPSGGHDQTDAPTGTTTDAVDGQRVGEGGWSGGGPPVDRKPLYKKPRENLSSVITKFQVRVRIVEARQLLASDLNPVCQVTVCGKSRQTQVKKGTSSPWYDELFFFHFESLPAELMENFMEFRVCNSNRLRSTTLVGSYKCEIGCIYDFENHSILNKWLVLAHPEIDTPTVQGYLKVSVAVLGPGDLCPDMEASQSSVDDVETNLLWTAGIYLQPAYFTINIYCAENLPRMDSGVMQSLKEILGIGVASKELVDPYLIASYAGREIQTRVMYNSDNPEFRQQMHIGFLFPSMCNSLRLTLMDWDRIGNDDIIGTACIPINNISVAGDNGFLPTFGPAYVNIYGARRKWELMESSVESEMNKSGEEGCSYRGRIMVSLRTTVGSYPTSPLTDMSPAVFDKVRRHRAVSNFMVMAHISHAYLIREASRPLEVEISMGNFGNKLENTLMPCPSSTHPSNPVFDGCKYYFLPWENTTPLITLPCQWEDVTHRMLAVNFILNIAQDLEEVIDQLKEKIKMKYGKRYNDLTQFMMSSMKRLSSRCSISLPAADPLIHPETDLDFQLRRQRQSSLSALSEEFLSLLVLGPEDILPELQERLLLLRHLAAEPQSSIPDVFIWLLRGTERLAFVRIPAHEILFSDDKKTRGRRVGLFGDYTLEVPGEQEEKGIGAIVRASLWFGKEDDARCWWGDRADLQLTVFAESYENQMLSFPGSGKWTTKNPLMTRPNFSDADGIRSLPLESFKPSEGWTFQDDWYIDPEPSCRFSLDAGHTIFTEEVFQQQARVVGGSWINAPTTWADVRGDPATPKDDLECPSGWRWRDLWAVDTQRAVDCEGWEYTVQKGITGWTPQQKIYHVLRRRRFIRERTRDMAVQEREEEATDGWEYGVLFGQRFHARERKVDMVRRRRWRRKLVPAVPDVIVTPRITLPDSQEKEEGVQITCPRQYVISNEIHVYQLRAHVYQARDLAAGDKTGFSDPYIVASFCNSTQQSERQRGTLCPTWDQTIVFDEIQLSGPFSQMQQCPPSVMVEVYDWDSKGAPDFLGRALCLPDLIDPTSGYKFPKLKWFQLWNKDGAQGELLASFELLLKEGDELPRLPPSKGGDVYAVPPGIRPLLQKTRVEILCWGVRNMASYELQPVTRPSLEFECGGQRVVSEAMKNLRVNANFDKPHLILDVDLPEEEQYMPPLSIRVLDHRAFGGKPVVATAVINDLHKYLSDPFRASLEDETPYRTTDEADMEEIRERTRAMAFRLSKRQASTEPGAVDTDIDWWSKFYASGGDVSRSGSYLRKGYEKLSILKANLEDEPKYAGFTDLVDSVVLWRGKGRQKQVAGEFKGTFRMYPLSSEDKDPPQLLASFPSTSLQDITVRVYVVMAKDLAPKDQGKFSDPYVSIKLGKETKSDKENYIPKTLNPVFGRMLEISGTLPSCKDLTVQVWDRDAITSDDLIGETTIDLENRFLTRHRATRGLPKLYHESGCNAWRDMEKPSEILHKYAIDRQLEGPTWDTSFRSLILAGKHYSISDFESEGVILPPTLGAENERLALYVLQDTMSLVPEYVETRDLKHPARPGLSQGRLLLWVDIFPSGITLPPPVDITPRKPHRYELRICIYNVYEAPLDERGLGGERMSDLYVKGWLQGTNAVMKTDIHYRSLDGTGNFNWRFVFPLEFIETEHKMVVKRKTHFWSQEEMEERIPPQLTLQLWDDDLVLRDDFLSEMTVNLCSLMKPAKSLNKAELDPRHLGETGRNHSAETNQNNASTAVQVSEPTYVNLFEVKRVFGFFPFAKVEDGMFKMAGKLEAEFEILSEEEAKLRPAGLGRDEPNTNPHLAAPNRPVTSFLWITSPWKSFRHIVWKNYSWCIITFIVLFFLLLFIFLFLYTFPIAAVDYILGVH